MSGTITFSGLASGIDVDQIIDATEKSLRATRVTPKENNVTDLEDTNEKLDELSTLLEDFQTLGQTFRAIAGGAVKKTASSTNETAVTAVADNAANNISVSVNVTQLAKNAVFSFNDSFSSTSTPLATFVDTGNNNITFNIGASGSSEEEVVTVPVTSASTTLDQLVSSFNSISTKAIASIVNVGTTTTPQYKFVVTTLNEGTLKGQINTISVGSDITGAGVFTASTHSVATDATFTVSGLASGSPITRYTNSVSDVFSGVTFNINNTGTSTITVSNDPDATISGVQEFVDKFNEIAAFIKENNLVQKENESDPNAKFIFSALARTSIDDNALTQMRTALSGSSYASGSEIKVLSDLGITTQRDGTIKFDSTVFSTALSKEPVSVREILENLGNATSALAADDGKLDYFTRFNGIIDLAVKANKESIENINDQIADAELFILTQIDSIRRRFSTLEATVGRLQNQQNALTSSLASLGR